MSRSFATRLRLAAVACALAFAFPGGEVAAQPASPHGNITSGVGDVPGGAGSIHGRVVRRVGRAGAEAIPVRLFALGTDGRPGMRETRTESDGAFVFTGIETDPGTVYLVAVQYGEIPFGARVAFEPGQTDLSPVIEIAEPKSATDAIEVGAVRLRFDRGCSGVRVTEAHVLRNPTDFVLHVPTDERETWAPVYDTHLPAAEIAPNSTLPGRNMPEGVLERRGDEVGYWGPLYPGEQTIEFSYSLPIFDGNVALSRRFRRGAESVAVAAFRGAPPVRGDSLAPAGDETIDGVPYAVVRSGRVAPDTALPIAWSVGDAASGASGLAVREATLWLELDDAALDVREQYGFEVSGGEPLRSDSDAPLLCLPLPPEMEDLRFSAEAFAMGIEPGAGSGLALRGPIPPGRSGFALSYLLRSGDDGVRFARRFGVDLSVLSLLIADTGVLATTDRLHRLRPARTTDRTYIHLEAFEVAADETVTVDLESLAPAQPLSRGAAIGFVTASALLSVFFLVGPLRGPGAAAESPEAVVAAVTMGERAAVYSAIRDLEDDFETGKISEEDRALMLGELRAQAGALLREERDRRSKAPAARDAAPAACSGCGAALPGDARFCPQCGARVGSGPPAGDSQG